MFIEAHVIPPADGRNVPLENKLCSLQLERLVFILCFLASLLLSLKVKFLNAEHKSNSELSYILCLVLWFTLMEIPTDSHPVCQLDEHSEHPSVFRIS